MTLLGTHVVRGAKDQTLVGEIELHSSLLGKTKVDQRQLLFRAQHDVARLQIAMQDARFVNGAEHSGNLRTVVQRFGRRQTAFHAPAQITAREILHGQVGVIIGNAELVKAHDIRVTDALGNFIFLQKTFKRLIDAGIITLRGRDLEHHQQLGLFALGDIELRHRAARQQPCAPVAWNERIAKAMRLARRR